MGTKHNEEKPRVDVTTATLADLSALVGLLGILFGQEVEFFPAPEKQARGLRLILEHPEMGQLFVVREGTRVVGMASILKSVSTYEGAWVGIVEDVILLPEYRGKGVGQQLFDQMLAWARAASLARLTLLTDVDNQVGQAFYRRQGFNISSMQVMRLQVIA